MPEPTLSNSDDITAAKDLANATGTLDAARIADGALSIAKTSGLQTALDGKVPKAESYVNITDYGAVAGVGVSGAVRTANTAAIQAAIDTHKTVFIPLGVWEISGTLTQAWNGQIITGASMTGSVISQADLTATTLLVSADPGSTNNPPSGSTGTANFPQIRNLCISTTGGVSTGSGIKTETISPATWSGDGLKLENLWVQNHAICYDIFATPKLQAVHILAKGGTTAGLKIWGNSNNTPHIIGLSASNCGIGLDIDDCVAGYFQLADFAGNTTHCTVNDSQVQIVEGEIEGASTFVNATSSRIILRNNRLMVQSLGTEPIIANAGTTIWLESIRRDQHVAGTPVAKTTSNTGRIMGPAIYDFASSTLSAMANDNAMQTLGWSSNVVVRILPIPWIDGSTWTTPAANMEGLLFAVPGNGTLDPGGDIRTVIREQGTMMGTGTQYRWASLVRPSFRTFNVTSGTGFHAGAPDIVFITNNSTGLSYNLLASSSNSYRAQLRGGYVVTVKNRSTISHNVTPNGADTIDGVGAAITLAAGESARLFTIGDGAWLTL
jgi:hypothetical protein